MASSTKKSNGSKKSTPKVSTTPLFPQSPNISINPVQYYDDFFSRNRVNHFVEGFVFDQDTFENVVASWADFDQIPLILNSSPNDLDVFCKALYGQNFKDAFNRMRAISIMHARHVLEVHANEGNATALAISRAHFAQLKDDSDSKPISVTIKNDLK